MQVDSGGDPLGRKSPCWDASPPVTVTVVKQGVCRGTLTWMCCVRKWALRHSSHTVKVTELYLQYFLLY